MYCCKTQDCPIAISNAQFPEQILCPGCQKLLSPVTEIKPEEEKLLADLPYVIAYPLHETIIGTDPLMKINLLKDTLLNFLKYLGLLAASEFFNSSLKDKKIILEFNKNLAQPSFGSWNAFIRECLSFLEKNNHTFFCPELTEYYKKIESGKKVKRYTGEIEIIDANGDIQIKKQEATGIGMLINFRNRYLGHGTTPKTELSKSLFNTYYPILFSLLEDMSFTRNYIMAKKEGADTYMLKGTAIERIEIPTPLESNVCLMKTDGSILPLMPFFIIPGELAMEITAKPEIFSYESFTGKSIKFFSPEGEERSTSGRILEKLSLLLKEKSTEKPFNPAEFTQDVFTSKLKEENEYAINTLKSEHKVWDGIYVHRKEIEQELIGWIGARSNIFFIAAEAGSGKTNLLVEMCRKYTAYNLAALFIRAGRMTKATLKDELAYLLNLDSSISLEKYATLSGTQAKPFIILLDGLNEASKSKEIWNEIHGICKLFAPGAIKFVISNRTNTEKDLDIYTTEKDELKRIYFSTGKTDNLKNTREDTLSSCVFHLTPLNMNEMKETWDLYVKGNRKRFKPQFSFDDIALHDRNIYNQINNPLLLRVFLETYHGKPISGKKNKQIHIWRDWFANFSKEEQRFLEQMADAIWKVGKNELLLDDLLQDPNLKVWLTTDQVSAPYPRLMNMGWISRYTKEMVVYLGFTVEGLLIYLLGLKLLKENKLNENIVNKILDEGNQLKISALESGLNELASKNDLDLISDLIDKGGKQLELCITPLLYFLKTAGAELTVEKLLEKPTDNDWVAFYSLILKLETLVLSELKIELLNNLMPKNSFKNITLVSFALKAIPNLPEDNAIKILSEIDKKISLLKNNPWLLYKIGHLNDKYISKEKAIYYFNKALEVVSHNEENFKIKAEIYDAIAKYYLIIEKNELAHNLFLKALEIKTNKHGYLHPNVANSFNNIGLYWKSFIPFDALFSDENPNDEMALDSFNKALEIQLKTLGEHPKVANTYLNIGSVWSDKGNNNKAIDFYNKAIQILLKSADQFNYEIVETYLNIGKHFIKNKDLNNAINFYNQAIDFQIKIFGKMHPFVADTYNTIASHLYLCYEDKSIYFYEKSLYIKLKVLGENHPDVISDMNDLAQTYFLKENYNRALELNKKVFETTRKGANAICIASCYKKQKNLENALYYFILAAEIKKDENQLNSLETPISKKAKKLNKLLETDKDTLDTINKCKKLAKEINKEEALPDWIKNMK